MSMKRFGISYAIVAGSRPNAYFSGSYNDLARTRSEAVRKARAMAQYLGAACILRVPAGQRRLDYIKGPVVACFKRQERKSRRYPGY